MKVRRTNSTAKEAVKFNIQKPQAGKDWLREFRPHCQEVDLRAPEATSADRARGLNKVSVGNCFDLLRLKYGEKLFKARQVYNIGETFIITVQTKQSKIFSCKGRKQVGSLQKEEFCAPLL